MSCFGCFNGEVEARKRRQQLAIKELQDLQGAPLPASPHTPLFSQNLAKAAALAKVTESIPEADAHQVFVEVVAVKGTESPAITAEGKGTADRVDPPSPSSIATEDEPILLEGERSAEPLSASLRQLFTDAIAALSADVDANKAAAGTTDATFPRTSASLLPPIHVHQHSPIAAAAAAAGQTSFSASAKTSPRPSLPPSPASSTGSSSEHPQAPSRSASADPVHSTVALSHLADSMCHISNSSISNCGLETLEEEVEHGEELLVTPARRMGGLPSPIREEAVAAPSSPFMLIHSSAASSRPSASMGVRPASGQAARPGQMSTGKAVVSSPASGSRPRLDTWLSGALNKSGASNSPQMLIMTPNSYSGKTASRFPDSGNRQNGSRSLIHNTAYINPNTLGRRSTANNSNNRNSPFYHSPTQVYSSASSRLALQGVLSRSTNISGSMDQFSSMDFRPKWR